MCRSTFCTQILSQILIITYMLSSFIVGSQQNWFFSAKLLPLPLLFKHILATNQIGFPNSPGRPFKLWWLIRQPLWPCYQFIADYNSSRTMARWPDETMKRWKKNGMEEQRGKLGGLNKRTATGPAANSVQQRAKCLQHQFVYMASPRVPWLPFVLMALFIVIRHSST